LIPEQKPRVLFISYNGLLDPLGPSQILPYVRALAAGYRLTLLSFEKPVRGRSEDQRTTERLERLLQAEHIRWVHLDYHQWPSLPATLYDIFQGMRAVIREQRRAPIALIHARGYVPAAIAWGVHRWTGLPYLFDIRGLQAEESADAGHWSPHGLRFRLTKRVEQWILRQAAGVVTLTEAIRPMVQMFPGLAGRPALPPWEVIPSCVDLEHFQFRAEGRKNIRAALGVGERPILIYAGSLGTWYLLEEMLDFYAAARQRWPELVFLILTPQQELVRTALQRRGVSHNDAVVRWARFEEMPDYLSAADVGIAFIKPCLSKRASSPTKYAEYLACGLPLVINAGIGDSDALVEGEGAGVLVHAFTSTAYDQAAQELQHHLRRGREAFRAVAARRFSLEGCAYPAYQRLYQRLMRGVLPLDDAVHRPTAEQECSSTGAVVAATTGGCGGQP